MGVMDLRERKSSLSGDVTMNENKKFCTDCKTTKTPLWRGGPAGPKSLCNACGIRYRKKRRAILGLSKGSEKKKEKSNSSNNNNSSGSTTCSDSTMVTANEGEKKSSGQLNGLSEPVKLRIFALGSEVLLQRSSAEAALSGVVKKQRCQRRRKLGEEEQAAFSLMALSCGSVFA